MKAVTIQGSSPTIYTTTYNQFKGVDFSTDAMLVDKSRSPYAVNLISDSGGMPEKRPGWRTLLTMDGKINGLWHLRAYGKEWVICHAGSALYELQEGVDGEWIAKLMGDAGADERSTAFFMNNRFYILTGAKMLECMRITVTEGGVQETRLLAREISPYVPTVVVNRPPNGIGGDFLQSYNIIGDTWKEEFIGDGKSKEFILTERGSVGVDAVMWVEVWEDDEWVTKTQGMELSTEGVDYVVDQYAGKITFKVPPADHTIPNVRVLVKKAATNKQKIFGAKSVAVYNDSVVFVAGAERGVDYRSGYVDGVQIQGPNYFPEDGYDQVGTNETDIMGYCKVGEYLGIIKESNSQDSTIYLRWHEYQTQSDGTEKTIYRKKQGVSGVGAVSRSAIGSLVDEPLFLSERGIYAVTSNAITFERTVQNRSEFLDFELTKEPNLKDAVCCEWKGYFMVCVNNHCYLLDSKQPTAKSRNNSNFVYEGYYWDNIPARCFMTVGDELYFGTADGRVCKFNTDIDGLERYNDDGQPIDAIWSTIADDDGHPQRLKTMIKKGCAVTIKPYNRSSAQVFVKTNEDSSSKMVREGTMDIFDWETIDFSRFTFNSNDAPQDIMLKKKVKKYKRLQFYVRNKEPNEGFGIFQITKSYIVLGLAKK